jgi:hypothetical protein
VLPVAAVALVAFGVTGVAAAVALPVAALVAGALTVAAGVAPVAATAPAIPTNETMLSPPSSQRVAAAG